MKMKKMNSYKKLGLVMLGAAIVGGVMGLLGAIILGPRMGHVEGGLTLVLTAAQRMMLPLLVVILAATVLYGEMNLRMQRAIGRKLQESEDEECDQWEYAEEKNSARGMIVNILSQVLCVLVLSVGYSMEYIESGNAENMLVSCIVFLVCFGYDGFWQVRFVKLTQKIHPEKKGDPATRKFQQEWLESCDEAEKEIIYQSAYKSYIQTNKCIPILLVVVMIGHLLFHTGLMAIVIVAVIWLLVTVSYLRSCVKLKREKIRE